jgi:hypothetical protein
VDSGAVIITVQRLLLVLVEEALSKLLFCVLELFWFCFVPLVRLVFLVGVVLVVFAGCYLLLGVWLLVCVTAVLMWCAQLECSGGCSDVGLVGNLPL